MPWTRDEEARVAKLEGQVSALRRDFEDADSVRRRERDEDRRAREDFLKSATRAIETAVAGKIDEIRPQLARVDQVFQINRLQSETLEEVRREILLSRDERVARKERDAVAEEARAASAARHRRRVKIAAILSPFLLVVVGALVSAVVSQLTNRYGAPSAAPSHK